MNDKCYLGQILLQKGYITKEQLEITMKAQEKNGDLLGMILIDFEYITGDQLIECLREQEECGNGK